MFTGLNENSSANTKAKVFAVLVMSAVPFGITFPSDLLFAATPSVTELVDSHTGGVGLIHAFDVEIEIDVYKLRTDESPVMTRWRWSKHRANELERIRYRYLDPNGETQSGRNSLGDLLRDGRTSRFLRSWDPEKPKELSLVDQGGVYASVEPQTPVLRGGIQPARSLLFSFALDNESVALTPSELLQWSPSVRIVGEEDVGGHRVWRMRFAAPDRGGKPSQSYFDLYFDPQVGYLVRKAVTRVKRDEKNLDYSLVREVTEFKDCGNGVFFPLTIETPGTNDTVQTASAIKLVVNETLPEDAFDFRFPLNCVVRQFPSDTKRQVGLAIKDSDDAPPRMMAKEEYDRAVTKMMAKKQLADSLEANWSRRRWILIGINIVLVISLGAFLFRRWHRRSSPD